MSLAKETSSAGELWVQLRDSAIINKVEKISRFLIPTKGFHMYMHSPQMQTCKLKCTYHRKNEKEKKIS